MAELVDAADSKSVFERSGSSILPRGTKHRFKVPLNAPWIHRETGHRAGFFVPDDLPLPARLHPEENIELWDTWMKRCDLKRRSLAMNTPQTTSISHLIITHF